MINLIPSEERKLMAKDFYLRLLSVFFIILGFLSIIACVKSGTAVIVKKKISGMDIKPRSTVPVTEKNIWCLNIEGSTVFINLQTAELLGYTIKQMIGKSIYQFLDKKNSITFREYFGE